MIDIDAIPDIVATYKKHGWLLRRILLSGKTKAKVADALVLDDVKIVDAEIDAAWFSRPPGKGRVAWEIRYLGDPPFALLESIDETAPDLEHLLRDVECRLIESIAAKISA